MTQEVKFEHPTFVVAISLRELMGICTRVKHCAVEKLPGCCCFMVSNAVHCWMFYFVQCKMYNLIRRHVKSPYGVWDVLPYFMLVPFVVMSCLSLFTGLKVWIIDERFLDPRFWCNVAHNAVGRLAVKFHVCDNPASSGRNALLHHYSMTKL